MKQKCVELLARVFDPHEANIFLSIFERGFVGRPLITVLDVQIT